MTRGRPRRDEGRLRTVARRTVRDMDQRYHSPRWRRLTKRVIAEDGRCYYRGCVMAPTCTDHISPVLAHTTDAEFFDRANLRASCFGHNVFRHLLEPGLPTNDRAKPRRTAYGGGAGARRLLSGNPGQDRTYSSTSPQVSPLPTLTGDYSRQGPDDAAG